MSAQLEGGCACGAVRYRLTSDPLITHCCHCLNCQRQTGSAFVVNLLIETDRVELLSGDPQPVDTPRDDGSAQRVFRCPTCQVAVFSQYTRPEVRFVRGGTLDDPAGVAPDVHIFTRSKVPWVTLPETTPAFDVYYDTKSSGRPQVSSGSQPPASNARRLRTAGGSKDGSDGRYADSVKSAWPFPGRAANAEAVAVAAARPQRPRPAPSRRAGRGE